jgi:Zn-dependent protease
MFFTGEGRGLKFRLFRTPVTIDWGFLLLVAILTFGTYRPLEESLLLVAVIFVSILLHEMGHALAFRVLGRSSRIVVHGFGGVTISEDPREMRDGEAIAVSLAGPAAEIALGLGALALQRAGVGDSHRLTQQLMADLVWVNVVWGLANLVPILPLDGGHVVERVVHRISPGLTDTLPPFIGVAVSVPIAVFAWTEGYQFGAFFALIFAVMNFRWLMEGMAEPKRRARIQQAEHALANLGHADPRHAIPALEAALAQELPADLHDRCTIGLAWALAWRGAPGDAERVAALLPQVHGRADTALLSAWAARALGRDAEAYALMTRGFSNESTEPPAWYVQRMLPTTADATQLAGWLAQLELGGRHVGLGRLAVSLEGAGRGGDAAEVRQVMARPISGPRG